MMQPIQRIRDLLRQWAEKEKVEVLPAAGGALEELQRPDIEELEDRVWGTGENIHDTVWERLPDGERIAPDNLYRPTPPIPRHVQHRFRYFIDGSVRSYFLGTVLEHDRDTPILYAQIGACALRREDDGTVGVHDLQTCHLLLAEQQLSPQAWGRLQSLCTRNSVVLVDTSPQQQAWAKNADPRNRANGVARFRMRSLEGEMMKPLLPLLGDEWLIMDGSLMFDPIRRILLSASTQPPVLGVSKNFRKDPQFRVRRSPRAVRYSIYRLLAKLPHEHRTLAFKALDGQVAFWYVRLRPQGAMDYPLMGVVKCELVTPSYKPPDSRLLDELSSALVAERSVSPHGRDRRWHAHLYPIYLAEQAIRSRFYSHEVVRQLMRWR
jgi:hypothetical protein